MTSEAERVKLPNLSVEDKNQRLATCLLTLGESASSAG